MSLAHGWRVRVEGLGRCSEKDLPGRIEARSADHLSLVWLHRLTDAVSQRRPPHAIHHHHHQGPNHPLCSAAEWPSTLTADTFSLRRISASYDSYRPAITSETHPPSSEVCCREPLIAPRLDLKRRRMVITSCTYAARPIQGPD
jgi:hypothetical protein